MNHVHPWPSLWPDHQLPFLYGSWWYDFYSLFFQGSLLPEVFWVLQHCNLTTSSKKTPYFSPSISKSVLSILVTGLTHSCSKTELISALYSPLSSKPILLSPVFSTLSPLSSLPEHTQASWAHATLIYVSSASHLSFTYCQK